MPQAPPPAFPLPLTSYPPPSDGLLDTLWTRVQIDPLNAVATAIFFAAVIHTFLAPKIAAIAHAMQLRRIEAARARGERPVPSVAAEMLLFFGEVEVVFGLWVIPLVLVVVLARGWTTAVEYLDHRVNYVEPMFVIVIMALASTRPIVELAERFVARFAAIGRGTPAAWWIAILTITPLLGSFITEPAAMTIGAVMLARKFYDFQPSSRLKYATLGLLFVNISIGGTLTHFAAPPVLMVARPWGWDTAYMLTHFGWRAALAILVSAGAYYALFWRELGALAARTPQPDRTLRSDDARPFEPGPLPIPGWVTAVHAGFMMWTVVTAHHPPLVLGGFLFFLGFDKATAVYSSVGSLKTPLLVGFFLAGLVIHGGLQGWWIAPLLGSLSQVPLFLGAALLTSFNDNALITYLATLVPDLEESLKIAVVQGAVVGGGLTVIANAPNPAGQALLARFYGHAINPLGLALGALLPTLIAAAIFLL